MINRFLVSFMLILLFLTPGCTENKTEKPAAESPTLAASSAAPTVTPVSKPTGPLEETFKYSRPQGGKIDEELFAGLPEVHLLAAKGNLKALMEKIDKDHSLMKGKDKEGKTPLHWAVYIGHRDVAAYLIKKGADVKARDNKGFTPVHMAALQIREEVPLTQEEKKKKIDWETRAIGGEMAALLIKNGADIHALTDDKRTPLHLSGISGLGEVTRTLVEAGAEVNPRDAKGKTPLYYARMHRLRYRNSLSEEVLNEHGGKE